MKNTFRAAGSAFAAVALLAGGFAFGGVATAATTDPVIDTNATGSINIHKRDGLESTTHADGKVNNNPGGTALNGVTYKVDRIKKADGQHYDFANSADLKEAKAIDPTNVPANRLEAKGTQTTSGNGETVFANLPVGVYLVTETEAPAGYVKSKPFLVFVPTSDKTNSNWIYDVHVYPKNSKVTIDKTVKDADKHQGEDIEYTITTGVVAPANKTNGVIKKYVVTDNIKTPESDVKFLAGAVLEVKIGNTVVPAAEYDVALSADGKTATVTFKEAGRTRLTNAVKADPNVKVYTKIKLNVGPDFNLRAGIVNGASLTTNPNNIQDEEDTTIPAPEVKTYFGKLKINKKSDQADQAPLAGAQFELYICDSKNALGKRLFANQTFTTNAQGVIEFPVVHVTDFADNKDVPPAAQKKLCVKETVAPAGYNLPTGLDAITELTFTRSDLSGQNAAATKLEKTLPITNNKLPSPELPLTGGAGIALFAVVGAGLIGSGVFVARRNTKKVS